MTLRRLTCLLATITFPCFASLLEAASKGNSEAVKQIIKSTQHNQTSLQETLEGEDFYGFTAIQLAVYYGYTNIVRILINAGANFRRELANEYDRPIQMAVRLGHIEIIERLVAAGIDPNLRFSGGHGLLHISVVSRQEESARTLIRLGADPHTPNRLGISPIAQAEIQQNTRMIEILSSREFSRRVTDALGDSFGPSWASGIFFPPNTEMPRIRTAHPPSRPNPLPTWAAACLGFKNGL